MEVFEVIIQLIAMYFFAASFNNEIVSGTPKGSIGNLSDINDALEKIGTLEALRDRETNDGRKQHIDNLIESTPIPLPMINTYHGEYDGFSGPYNIYSIVRRKLSELGRPEWMKEGISCRYCSSLTVFTISATVFIVASLTTPTTWLFFGIAVRGFYVELMRWLYHYKSISASDW